MGVPFDHIASTYDSVFTNSAIGQIQRKRVWAYIEKVIPQLTGFEMLELNCGTGEDALLFSEKGFNILATDISHEMLKLTNKKAAQYSMQNRISSHYLDLDSFDETIFDHKFDLVFSNFGGLNCINPESMKTLLQKLPLILKPGGRFVAVVMPNFCAWESLYFLSKLEFSNIFRRMTSAEVMTYLHGATVKTWYYSSRDIRRWSRESFYFKTVKPVGFTIPPSYLENFFSNKRWLLTLLHRIERRLLQSSVWSAMSDHFIIDLQLKP
jgi:ubiquinone/menaquinone biosynthesis C-methylase UbiE